MMRAPPHEPPIERSRTATPSIPIQTMTLGIVGDSGPALEAMATSAPAVPQEARIGGLKLEMPEKYTGSLYPCSIGMADQDGKVLPADEIPYRYLG